MQADRCVYWEGGRLKLLLGFLRASQRTWPTALHPPLRRVRKHAQKSRALWTPHMQADTASLSLYNGL